MKQIIFLTLFILTFVYANSAHSVLAVHDEWTQSELEPETMIFYGDYYCDIELSKFGEDWKLELELCEEKV